MFHTGYTVHGYTDGQAFTWADMPESDTLQAAIKLAEAKRDELAAKDQLCNIFVRRPDGQRFWVVERFLKEFHQS